jgi:hypothetical protein
MKKQSPAPAASNTKVHDQTQLAANREAVDFAVRANFVGQVEPQIIPAKAGTPAVAPVTMPALYPREVYAGVGLGVDGVAIHLILLPGDVRVFGVEEAEEFAHSIGGTIPSYSELEHMRKTLPDQFKGDLYYTSDIEDYDGGLATMFFDAATEAERATQAGARNVRARAVRRVLALANEGAKSSISARHVELLAERLIDQHAAEDDDDVSDRERMVGAGIKVGIGLMAMEIQNLLAARQRQPGAPNA